MKTFYDRMIELIPEGYGIGIERYTTNVTVYSFMKVDSEKSRTIYGEIAKDIAKLLIYKGAKIVYVQKKVHALNFKPLPVDPGCIRYQTSELNIVNTLFD